MRIAEKNPSISEQTAKLIVIAEGREALSGVLLIQQTMAAILLSHSQVAKKATS